MMRLSELQNKDVISVTDGKKIGNIVDALIDNNTGMIVKLVVEPSRALNRIFQSKEELEVHFTEIVKIGEDVILVDLSRQRPLLLK